jgi:hypothetical protein
MKPALLYRIAAAVLVLFALGHTYGFLSFNPSAPAAIVARQAMDAPFRVDGSTFSYGNFYMGFGLFISAYQLFSAFLAWHLGRLASTSPACIGALGWAFALLQVVGIVLSLKYFAIPQVVFSALLAICLMWPAWLVQTRDPG